jgi:hypothetical protein
MLNKYRTGSILVKENPENVQMANEEHLPPEEFQCFVGRQLNIYSAERFNGLAGSFQNGHAFLVLPLREVVPKN